MFMGWSLHLSKSSTRGGLAALQLVDTTKPQQQLVDNTQF